MLIYTIDKADRTQRATRKVTIDFFKQVFGFQDENIIEVDRTEFIGTTRDDLSTKFSAETKELMNKFARPVFEGRQYLLANQVLNIAICECQGGDFNAGNYFVQGSNFELTIRLYENFTLINAREYFDSLRQKIIAENITQIIFKQ